MKKIYTTPVIEIEKFDVEDVIMASGATPTAATITGDETTGYNVDIVATW